MPSEPSYPRPASPESDTAPRLLCAAGASNSAPADSVVSALQDELIACNRLAMLGNVAAMAAHEYNNLLTPIVARTEAALHAPDDAAFVRTTLERTLTQARRAVALSRHLLEMAHDWTRPAELCSVAQAAREALETSARPFEKDGIEVRLEIPDGLHVCAQADLLSQVLLNLVLNAREAMKPNGGLLVIRADDEGAFVRLAISDTGRGIPRDRLDRVLNPFLAAEPTARPHDWHAVGLGLSVCRLIATRHGARMQASANEGRGCTFTLWWPTDTPSRAS